MNRLIFIEQLLNELNFKDETKIIVITFWVYLLLCPNTCNVY